MTKATNAIVIVLGAWLIISPLLLRYAMPGLAITMCVGVATVVLGASAFSAKAYRPVVNYVIAFCGAATAVWGVAALAAGMGFGVNEIVSGLLVAMLSFAATRFRGTYAGASFYDRGGSPMVDVQSLRLKDGDILMKALLLQSMPSTVYVRPEEVWKVITMVPFDLIKALPGYLYRGYRICKQEENSQRQSEKMQSSSS